MKLKDYIVLIACLIGGAMAIFGGDTWLPVMGVSIIYMCLIVLFIYKLLIWNKNKKDIKGEYVRINIETVGFEMLMLLSTYSNIKNSYSNRVFYFKYINDEIIEINNFRDFLNSYNGIEKVMLYMTMGVAICAIISIIKKIVCRGRISSDKILFSNGEIINIKDIEYINVDNALWSFAKKITVILGKTDRVFYLNNKSFVKIEKDLCNIGINNNLV